MRTEVTRLVLRFPKNGGISISSLEPFTFIIRPWSVEALGAATHHHELVREPQFELCLDYLHAGTGNTCLRAERLPQYQIVPRDVIWPLELKWFSTAESAPTR